MFKSPNELRQFIASLRIPDSRRALLESELLDHLESGIAAGLATGQRPDEAERDALAALGEPDALRVRIERIEPAFDLVASRATVMGAVSALAASGFFAIAGALLPRTGSYALTLALAVPTALCGLMVMRLLAPRGVGAAVWAEARASIERGRPQSARRRAVAGYVWSVLLVPHAIFASDLFEVLPRWVGGDILLPFGLLGLAYGSYALHVMRGARRERALVRTAHGR